MDRNEISKQIIASMEPFVKNKAALENAGDNTSLADDLQFNSLRLIDVTIALEDKFNITIGDDDIERINTIGDIVELVQNHI